MSVLVLFVDHGVPDGDHDGVAVSQPTVPAEPLNPRRANRVSGVPITTELHDLCAVIRVVEEGTI